MPFKIIQTIEKGRRRLSIVPSIWEEDGKLFWPSEKIKNRARLVRDETSFPSPNWEILDCVVKRNNYQTYLAAEYDMQIMEYQTDTDNETPETSNRSATVFGEMVKGLTHDYYNEITIQLLGNQNLLLEKIDNQEKTLKNIVENMQKLTQKVEILSVQLNEGLATIIEKIDQQPVNVVTFTNPDDNEPFHLEQIDKKQALENLENNLMDNVERTKLKKQLLFLCQPCEGKGTTFAYKLLDSLITREFLCNCSWSGASRRNFSKIALKNYKNFIGFFCDMIRTWDSTFTMGQTEMFFKICLKNAVKRQSMKDLRSSTKRTRNTKPKSQNSTV